MDRVAIRSSSNNASSIRDSVLYACRDYNTISVVSSQYSKARYNEVPRDGKTSSF